MTTTNNCTWRSCTAQAEIPQRSEDGEIWANLCVKHANELDISMTNPHKMLRSWALAHGTKEHFASRMMGKK